MQRGSDPSRQHLSEMQWTPFRRGAMECGCIAAPGLRPIRIALALALCAALGLAAAASSGPGGRPAPESRPALADKAAEAPGDRPLLQNFALSEVVTPQEAGEVQVTLGTDYASSGAARVTTTRLAAEYGLRRGLQVSAELPRVASDPGTGAGTSGLGDLELGILAALRPHPDPLAVSISLGVSLPTGRSEAGLGEGEAAFEPGLLAARRIGSAWLYAGLGAELRPDARMERYELAAVAPVQAWRATLELNGTTGEERSLRLTPGLVWGRSSMLEIGAGLPLGLMEGTPRWGLILKLTRESE